MTTLAPSATLTRPNPVRVLLFLAASVPIGAAALALLIAGWTTLGVLAITPLVVPILVGFRGAVGLLAAADSSLARGLLGVQASPRISSGGKGFWRRGLAVLADAGFWKQQAYLLLRMTVGFALATAELTLLAAALGSIAFPAWYRWSDLRFGDWHVDTLARSFVLVPAGLVGLGLALLLTRPLGAFSAWLVRALLDERRAAEGDPRESRRRALRAHASLFAGLGALVVVVWALAGGGYFWPEWVLVPLGLVLALHAWVELAAEGRVPRLDPGVAVHLGVALCLSVFLVLVWAVTSRGSFWPAWVMIPLAGAVAVHALVARANARRRLARRVETLEATRAGAVEEQGVELRRIERDLHDGAQARLVALGMSLGMAEQKLGSDPEEARQLLAEARSGVAEALRELRDLARGVYPPVLSDRGLGAAVSSLADRSAIPVEVSVSLDERPARDVEAAAYFVVAEALANAAKYSGARRVTIDVHRRDDVLEARIADDGDGGADPAGSGLVGLRRRVEALDGNLTVTSPPGGPTTVLAELPCGS